MQQESIRTLPLVIAHRGGRFWEGSNFSYISDSIRDGADIVELDVRLTEGCYVVQHGPFDRAQGALEAALGLLTDDVSLYLDIKTNEIDINALIIHVRSRCGNHIIVGSFDLSLLQKIEDPMVERNLHCWWPPATIVREDSGIDWVNPVCYFVTEGIASDIRSAGLKFTPSGNLLFKKRETMRNQLRFAQWGAYAISTHHVKEMRQLLDTCIRPGTSYN